MKNIIEILEAQQWRRGMVVDSEDQKTGNLSLQEEARGCKVINAADL